MRVGRRIYDNLRKAMTFIIAVHIPIAGLALVPLVTGYPLILLPIHIAFLGMVIDPICAIVFEAEPEERDVMRRPPRDPTARILTAGTLAWAGVQGLFAFVIVAAIYLAAARAGWPESDIRTNAFVALILVNLALVVVNRSFGFGVVRTGAAVNRTFVAVAAIALALLGLAVFWPPLRSVFGFGSFHVDDLAITLHGAGGLIAILETVKAALRRWPRQTTPQPAP